MTADAPSFADRWNQQVLWWSLAALAALLLWSKVLSWLAANRKATAVEEAVTEVLKAFLVVCLVSVLFELAEFRKIVFDELHSIVSIKEHLADPEYLNESFSDDYLDRVVSASYAARASKHHRPLLDGESELSASVYFNASAAVAKRSLSITRSQRLQHKDGASPYFDVSEHVVTTFRATAGKTPMPQPSLNARIRPIVDVTDKDQYSIVKLLICGSLQDPSLVQPRIVHADGFILFQVTSTLPLPAIAPIDDPVYELTTHKLIPYEDVWIGSIVAPTSNLRIELGYEPDLFEQPRLYLISSVRGANPIPPLETGIPTTVTWQCDDLLLPNDGWVVTWTKIH